MKDLKNQSVCAQYDKDTYRKQQLFAEEDDWISHEVGVKLRKICKDSGSEPILCLKTRTMRKGCYRSYPPYPHRIPHIQFKSELNMGEIKLIKCHLLILFLLTLIFLVYFPRSIQLTPFINSLLKLRVITTFFKLMFQFLNIVINSQPLSLENLSQFYFNLMPYPIFVDITKGISNSS